jgi:galactitol-specific phosphotransferase system IIB component
VYSEYISWEKSILTNSIDLFRVSKEIQENVTKLKKHNIFILANFIKGSSIIDRLYNSINFVNELKNKY